MHLVFKIYLIILVPIYGSGMQFLSLPMNAIELVVGSHPTILGTSQTNPALYQTSTMSPRMTINGGEWFGGLDIAQLGYSQSLNKNIWHLGLKYSGISDLEYRDNSPDDNANSHFSSYSVAVETGLSIAKIKKKYGISISLISFGIYDESSNGFGLNLGYYHSFKKGLAIGASILNIGKMYEFDNNSPSMPTRIISGVSKNISYLKHSNTFYASIEKNYFASDFKYYLGNEYNWNRLKIMCGFSSSKDVLETSIGFGVNLNLFQILYGVRFGSQQLGTPQIFSFIFNLS